MQTAHETYIHRCLELALLGEGKVMPNPMVGAVLVHEGRVIGEGWHKQYGGPHAEVNCLNSVSEADKGLISSATLYVSLEPCAHFGKTPPCADLIIQNRIPKVVIGCRDPFEQVNGKGIEKLKNAGIDVVTGLLEHECLNLNKRFFTFHTKRRPYIILKWAQTANGMIGSGTEERLLISNELSNRMVHQWRSEEAAILIGTNTALQDDPSLTNRFWTGNTPVRMVIDKDLRLPSHLQLFNQQQKTIVFNSQKQEENGKILFCKIDPNENILKQIMDTSYKMGLQSILVEGGSKLLQSFINANQWDEVRLIKNEKLEIKNGIAAPLFHQQNPYKKQTMQSDTINFYTNKQINQ